MDETQAALDRLERRIDEQAARIDALSRTLEQRGLVPRAAHTRARERRRSSARFHLGTATGV